MFPSTSSRIALPFRTASSRLSALATIGLSLGLALGSAQGALAQVGPESVGMQSPESKAIVFAGPPAEFNPLTASRTELEQYGIPPRPDPSDEVPFARWKKLVMSPQTRVSDLVVTATKVFHGTLRNGAIKGTANGTTTATSNNWSAYAITDAKGTFTPNDSYVYGEWNVPAAGVDNCNYAPYMSSQWIGFDGAFVSGDVLQAGTEVDGCPARYSAWYEWFTSGCTVNSASQPCYSYSLNLPVNPGDLMVGEVWYTTAAPHGHAYLYNYTTQSAASVAFNQPTSASANYVGNSAEWVVERPDGGAYNLTNYVADQFNWTLAYNGSSYFYPGSSPASATVYNISMTCPGWSPSSSCPSTEDISTVDLFSTGTLWFYSDGPAYQ
jgi:hypothetical protein